MVGMNVQPIGDVEIIIALFRDKIREGVMTIQGVEIMTDLEILVEAIQGQIEIPGIQDQIESPEILEEQEAGLQ